MCETNERLFYLELATDGYPADISWEVRIFGDLVGIFDAWTIEVTGGNYKEKYETYKEERCLPSDQCYQFRMKDSYGDGLCPSGIVSSSNCGSFRAEYDGEIVLEGGSDYPYSFNKTSPTFGFDCQTEQPSISLAPSSSISPSASPSISPNPTLNNIYPVGHRDPLIYFFLFGGCIFVCCCCFATKTRYQNAISHRENNQRHNELNTEREERRAFILTNVVVESRRKKDPNSSDEDDNWEEETSNKEETVSDLSAVASQRQESPKESLRNLFQARGGGGGILKGLGMSTLENYDLCAICLEGYKEKDEICSSRNKMCPHNFHLDCMVSWLMNHDECPICRLPFLVENVDLENDGREDE